VHNLPNSDKSSRLYSHKRQYLEIAMYAFLIFMMVSSHLIVLGGFLHNRKEVTIFATLGASLFFSVLIVYLPPENDASKSDKIVKTECFYEHVHETFLVVFFVFVGQIALTAFLVYFVVYQDDNYDFPTEGNGRLDTQQWIRLFLALSVDYVRFREFKGGFRPLRIAPMIHNGDSEENIILKKVDSAYHYFTQPTKMDLYLRAAMRSFGEVWIPLFILIISPVLLTFTQSPIDVLLNILGLTFIGVLDNSFGTAEYRLIKK